MEQKERRQGIRKEIWKSRKGRQEGQKENEGNAGTEIRHKGKRGTEDGKEIMELRQKID